MVCSQTTASNFFSTISLISWVTAQFPQIYKNYISKSTESISPIFLALWFMGDLFSFLSCLINDVLPFQISLSVFFVSVDTILLSQKYYYRVNQIRVIEGVGYEADDEERAVTNGSDVQFKNTAKTVGVGLLLHTALSNAYSISDTPARYEQVDQMDDKERFGSVLAWACAIIYVISRVPQIIKNYERRSVEGISPILFGAALCGNLGYSLSILSSCEFLSGKEGYFASQLPYMMGSGGTIVFDIVYFWQRYKYGRTVRYNDSAHLL